jgi:ankyrin repeat protein
LPIIIAMTDPLWEFIEAACVPLDSGHATGTLERADAVLDAHPEVAAGSICAAAILADEDSVRRFLASDPCSATANGGPRGWDPLTYLCFSRYLRLDPAQRAAFMGTAKLLLDAEANPNTGWFDSDHQPDPVWESALYGAAGIAHHAGLTRLLLDRGADPNDGEVPYHAPEGYDNEALKVLVEGGRLNPDSMATILLRKADWHDRDAILWLLEQGADPNRMTRWGRTALHHALLRDNALPILEAMLDHGADPTLTAGATSGVAMAARRGRGDALALFERRGISLQLEGVERLIASCATNDAAGVKTLIKQEPGLVDELVAEGGQLLAEFAGNGNTDGVRQLLDLGVDVTAPYKAGDGYFGIAEDSIALHVAAWRARHATVKLLIERGSPVDATDGEGRTPLSLAVKACVDSYWMDRRSPESVELLLRAGASTAGVVVPTGFADVDERLRAAGAQEAGITS